MISSWNRAALGILAAIVVALWTRPTLAGRPTEPEPAEAAPDTPSAFGVWAEVEGGVSSLQLRTLAVNQAAGRVGFVDTNALVPVMGAGAGVRLSVVSLGPRVRVGRADGFDLWSLGGELSIRVPISIFEPYIDLGGGQAAIANIKDPDSVAQGIAPISGYYARIGGGIGVRPRRWLEVSARATWEFIGLAPSGANTAAFESIGRDVAIGHHEQAWEKGRRLGGMGYGSTLSFTAGLSLRF